MSFSKLTACGFLFTLSLNASYLGVFMALLSILYTFSLCGVESFLPRLTLLIVVIPALPVVIFIESAGCRAFCLADVCAVADRMQTLKINVIK